MADTNKNESSVSETHWQVKFQNAREAFLDMIADCHKWDVEHDADTDSNGRTVDCSIFILQGPIRPFEYLCEMLDIKQDYCESIKDSVDRALEAEPAWAEQNKE